MNRKLLLTLLFLPLAALAQVTLLYRVAGQPSGTYNEASVAGADGATKTTVVSDLIFNRMGAKVEIKISTAYTEARDGHLTSVISDTSSSQQTTHMDAEVADASIHVTTTTGGKSYERTIPVSGTLLGPDSARKLVVSHLHGAGDTFSYATFSPEVGNIVTITNSFVGSEPITVDGEKIDARKCEQSVSGMPAKETVWVDTRGWPLRELMPSPFGDIEAVRSNAPDAEQASSKGASLPRESFTSSLVKANIPLTDARRIDELKLKITHHRPELGWPELNADNQRVLEKTANYVVLEVTRVEPAMTTATRPEQADAATGPYLSANALLQSDDAEIQRIAGQVAGNEHNAWRAAEALQRWTHDNMHFDLGIAIAPASEVARNRRGTCFGYAMMLGSLTRAVGIPSRVRMGYVYAGGIWGGHAWVDVKIGDQWIPLDSAVYAPGSADAARFSFFTSSLEEGTLAGIGSLQQLFGNVDIEVLEYTADGKHYEVQKGTFATANE